MTSSKIAVYAVFLLGVLLGVILGQTIAPEISFGATVYQTNNPSTIQTVDFPIIGSGIDATPNYVFLYQIPQGISFSRIEIATPESFVAYSKNLYLQHGNATNSCDVLALNDNCLNTGFESKYQTFSDTATVLTSLELTRFNFSQTTATSSNYLYIVFDPNTPLQDFTYFGTNIISAVAANGSNYTKSRTVPSLRLCDGACNTTFNTEFVSESAGPNSAIAILKPDYGTTTATTTVDLEVFFAYDGTVSTTTKALIQVYDAVNNQLEHEISQIIPSFSNSFNFVLPATFEMSTGSKTIVARYTNITENVDYILPKTSFFNVINNSYLLATGLETPTSDPFELTQIDCNLFDVGCQFQKALIYVFVPPQTTLDKFTAIWQELRLLKPFGYITIMLEQLRGINNSETGAYLMPNIPFMTEIFLPLKSGISILLWGLFAFVFYNKRLKSIDI